MHSRNKNAIDYNINNIERFNKLCQVVVDHSPISFVGYFKIFADGSYLNICNDLTWQEYFVNKVHSHGANFQRAVENTPQTGPCKFLWPQKLDDPVFNALFSFNIWNGLSIYSRGDNCIESWTFASHPEHDQVLQLYLNNPFIFDAFGTYAMQKDRQLFDDNPTHRGCFKEGINLYSKENGVSDSLVEKIPLLRGGIMNATGQYMFLSKREVDCLKLLVQGKTAQQVGEILDLSKRTVEYYLDNIKNKAGYRKKSEILEKFYGL